MALNIPEFITRKQLAELLNVQQKQIYTYQGREKFMIAADGLIDTTIKKNKQWIESMYLKRKNTGLLNGNPFLKPGESEFTSPHEVVKQKVRDVKKEKIKQTKQIVKEKEDEQPTAIHAPLPVPYQHDPIEDKYADIADIELELKKEELNLKRKRAEQIDLQNYKISGKLIPFDAVRKFYPTYIEQLKNRLFTLGNNTIMEIASGAGYTHQEIAGFKSAWRDHFNEHIAEAKRDVVEAAQDMQDSALDKK